MVTDKHTLPIQLRGETLTNDVLEPFELPSDEGSGGPCYGMR